MRALFAACVALSALAGSVSMPAKADVVVRTDEVPYWRGHHQGDWHARRDWREAEHRHQAWLASHCVRDWQGVEYCR